ncbi:MAG: GAF domain-containing protein [Planctomycetes bacterium]|nr:GAF domain-containing protein [Planctomycetota bacterium]
MTQPQPTADQPWLEQFLAAHGGIAGTVHRREGNDLLLTAQQHLPPPVAAIVARVPKGKGMAGLAFERKAPVQTCNLKTDTTGDVRPGAKAVDAQAAVALPVFDELGEVRAIVGIAWRGERELAESELEALRSAAGALPV